MASRTRVAAAWVGWAAVLNVAGVAVYHTAGAPLAPQEAAKAEKADPQPLVPPRVEPNPGKDDAGKKDPPKKDPDDPPMPVPPDKEPKTPDPEVKKPKTPDPEIKKPKAPDPEEKKGPKSEIELPRNVNWAVGDQLVLIVDPGDQPELAAALTKEVEALKADFADRLVGGDVFVVSGTKLRRWAERGEGAKWGGTVAEVFVKVFQTVGTARTEVIGEKAKVKQTLVIWHSVTCPAEIQAAVRPVPESVVIWSGKDKRQQEEQSVALEAVFSRDGFCPQGRSVAGVAQAAASYIPKPKP